MPAQMFDADGTYRHLGSRRWYTMPLAVLTHAVIIGAIVVAPLLATDMLPSPASVVVYILDPPASPPPAPELQQPPESVTAAPTVSSAEPASREAAPVEEPDAIGSEIPGAAEHRLVIAEPGVPAGVGIGTVAIGPPPAPRQERDAHTGPVRVGGDIREPRRLSGPSPVYPALARAARADGEVRLEAVIATDGRVKDARVVQSDPMFDEAALHAVRQWRYTVPMLNGQPIEVIMTVTVRFSLNR